MTDWKPWPPEKPEVNKIILVKGYWKPFESGYEGKLYQTDKPLYQGIAHWSSMSSALEPDSFKWYFFLSPYSSINVEITHWAEFPE